MIALAGFPLLKFPQLKQRCLCCCHAVIAATGICFLTIAAAAVTPAVAATGAATVFCTIVAITIFHFSFCVGHVLVRHGLRLSVGLANSMHLYNITHRRLCRRLGRF
jgi:hypothetical protein